MNATELSQIVVDPKDRTDEIMEVLADAGDQGPDPFRSKVKLLIGRALHPFGIHTWVRFLYYDAASMRVMDMNGEVCTWCPKARLR